MQKSNNELLKILVIEDDNSRIKNFDLWLLPGFRIVSTTSAGSALGLIQRDKGFVYAAICLDHDLQGQTKTVNDQDLSGTTVVKSIIRHMDKSIPILVHSMNPKRGPIMANMLKSAGFKDVIRISMDDLNKTLFQEWLQEVRENWADEHED
ncbi:MAG TPA: hypothetical protein DCG34_04835 [Clostridiales bacterium]|nr:hypothetical protein [Clostridiales bacterium]